MSASFILDCSLTMSWCFTDEATPDSAKILDRLESETVLVPALWYLEVTNSLAMAERKKRITPAKTAEFLTRLSAFDIEVDHDIVLRAFDQIPPLCRCHSLTSYDAVYLELAMRRQLPIATLDVDLREAARNLGLTTIET